MGAGASERRSVGPAPTYCPKMKCYFLRHGLAGDPARWQGRDFDRPLTSEGCERMAREAKTIAALCLDLDCIVTSPLVRARQTAEIVADRLGLRARLFEDERLGLGLNVASLLDILHEHPNAGAILLVGHEPSLSTTVGRLAGGADVEVKKGALACIEMNGGPAPRGRLTALIPPKVLAL